MMKLSTILISIFMISLFTTGFIGMVGGLLSASSKTLPERGTFGRSNSSSHALDTIAGMYNISEMSQNQTVESDSLYSDVLTNFVVGAWSAVWQLFTLPAFFGGLIADLTGMPGMPIWITTSLYAIISVVILFGIYYFFTGRDS